MAKTFLKKFRFSGLITLSFLLFAIFMPWTSALAQSHNCPPELSLEECARYNLNQVGETSGLGDSGDVQATTLAEKIGNIIAYVMGFLGIVFLILIIISGIQWMTSEDKDKIASARSRIQNAIIGLIIVLAAYAITWFVVTRIRDSVNTTPAASLPIQKALAQTSTEDILRAGGRGSGYDTNVTETTLPALIGRIIEIVLGFVGTIFFIIILYSGFQWMTAGGNEEAVKKAKDRLINGVIGVVIIVIAYFITYLVTSIVA